MSSIGAHTGSPRAKRTLGFLPQRQVVASIQILFVAAAVGITVWTIYLRIFSGFSWWDDEGYLMQTVYAVLHGRPLFDQVYTLYGPFYYFAECIFYAVTGYNVSHDCVRMIALVLWPIPPLLFAWCVHRMTRSVVLSLFTVFEITRLLTFFAWEPGHPEEICIVLIAALFVVMCGVRARVTRVQAIALGSILAALALTKVNVGLYVGLTVLLSLLATATAAQSKRIFYCLLSVGGLLCIVAIMLPLLHFSWARNYCIWMVLALLAVQAAAYLTGCDVEVTPITWIALVLAAVLATLIITVPFLLHGSSIQAMLYITLLQHASFAQHWYMVSPFTWRTVLWCAASFLLAVCWAIAKTRGNLSGRFLFALQILKGGVGLFGVYKFVHAPFDRVLLGTHTMMAIGPFVWLTMVEPLGHTEDNNRTRRIVLAFLAVFLSMYPFPVAGSQSLFAIVPLLPIIVLFLHDAAITLRAEMPARLLNLSRSAALAAASLALAAGYWHELRAAHRLYAGGVSMGLPGATRIRVPEEQVQTFRWLTREVEQRCESFFTMPGMYSFYFWTHQESPTTLTMNDWPAFFDVQQQQSMLDELKHRGTSCVIYNPDLVEFLRAGQDLSLSPLARYVHDDFTPIANRNGYYFLLRK